MKVRATTLALALLALVAFGLGCTTRAQFVLPPGTEIAIYKRPAVTPDAGGQIEMNPFFWDAAAGVPYKLTKNGEVVKEGKLRAKFRVVSIFWPPAAIIYWPMGFRPDVTHDLTKD